MHEVYNSAYVYIDILFAFSSLEALQLNAYLDIPKEFPCVVQCAFNLKYLSTVGIGFKIAIFDGSIGIISILNQKKKRNIFQGCVNQKSYNPLKWYESI